MPVFKYRAKDGEDNLTEGEETAGDKFDLASSLKNRGLTIVSLLEKKESEIIKFYKFTSGLLSRVTLQDKINFARNVGVMIGSGISLSRALEIELRQGKNQKFAHVIIDIINKIKSGSLFSKALSDHPKIFPRFFKEMVVAGEKSGKLEDSLKLVVLQLSKEYALQKKVKGAMVYPAIVMVSLLAIAAILMTFVVPSLVATFKELNTDLPASTSFVIFISDFTRSNGLILLLILIGVGYAGWYFFKTEFGERFLDYIFTHTPLIKEINKKFNAARVCRTISSLLSSGIPIVESFGIAQELLSNHLYKKILTRASDSIKKGEPISKSFLAEDSPFPPLVGEMIAVGEETGKTSSMLLELARFYESEVSSATKELSTVIEPLLMIIVGAIVGFFAISMISPMYDLAGGF